MRCFLAIDLNDEIKESIYSILKNYENGIKKVEKENLHITLHFFGELPENDVKKISETLNSVKFHPFRIKIKGIGAFPSFNYIRVLWVGVKSDELKNLVREIYNALELPMKKFESHITIARVKRKPSKELMDIIERYKHVDVGEQVVDKFVLKKSILTPNGPIYEDIKEFPLIE